MYTDHFQFGDQNNSDVKLQIICSDGTEYDGNPLFLHSQVLKKSKFFEARLSERWSSNISSFSEIKLTVPQNGSAESYIKCIRLMYSCYSATHPNFSGVDETLDILSVAAELLFENCIQACMQYLEAVFWTPRQKLKIGALLSSLQVTISVDLAARLRIAENSFSGELELLKKKLLVMFSKISSGGSVFLPLQNMKNTMEKYMVANFDSTTSPDIRTICREALLNECRLKIEDMKYGKSMEVRACACKTLVWLLDLMKLCHREIFEAAFKMLVEDARLPDIILQSLPFSSVTKVSSRSLIIENIQARSRLSTEASYSRHLLDILVDRFVKALAKGEIIAPKYFRTTFLKTWIPVMAHLILRLPSCYDTFYDPQMPKRDLEYSNRFVEGVTKVVGSLPSDAQKQMFMFCADASEKYQNREKEAFQWWIDMIWSAVTTANSSCFSLSEE